MKKSLVISEIPKKDTPARGGLTGRRWRLQEGTKRQKANPQMIN